MTKLELSLALSEAAGEFTAIGNNSMARFMRNLALAVVNLED